MAVDVGAFVVVFLLVVVSPVEVYVDEEMDESALATRTLISAAVFDGRVVAPIAGGRLLFRIRRVYKGWHGDVDDNQRVTTLKNSDVSRLIFVSCRSSDSGRLPWQQLSDGCRLTSALVGRRYLVFAESFHGVVVNVAVTGRRPVTSKSVASYRSSFPLVPLTARSRRVAVLYSNLGFGWYQTTYSAKHCMNMTNLFAAVFTAAIASCAMHDIGNMTRNLAIANTSRNASQEAGILIQAHVRASLGLIPNELPREIRYL